MKLVIPTNDKNGLKSKVAKHFGRCSTYTFVDKKGKVVEIIDNNSEHMGGVGLPPELMKKYGATVLLCRDIGPKAIKFCQQLGIDVYVCQIKTVEEIFNFWKNNKIEKASVEEACSQYKN